MAFEDPSKLKIDLVVGSEESNQEQSESSSVELEQSSDPSPTSESAPPVASADAAVSTDMSLTPWKNRFAKGSSTPKSWQGRIGSIAFKILDIGTIGLSIITILLSFTAVSASAFGPNLGPSFPTGLLLSIPVGAGSILYAVFVVRMLAAFSSLKPKLLTCLRVVAPLVSANTMIVWGIILAYYALGVATTFSWVRGLEHSLSHQQMANAMAAFSLAAAGLLQLSLILLLVISIVIYHKFFQWIDKRTVEIHGVSFGGKKAGLFGIIAGACFGFSGLYIALEAGGPNTPQYFAAQTLIWSIGILLSSLFFSAVAKFRNHKPTQSHD